MNDLEQLASPIFVAVCNYRQLVKEGKTPSKEQFQSQISGLLSDAKSTAELNPVLAKSFSKIEKPLVFFIDYIVKEGGFPFAAEWREMARGYNELSGDEKFFNLLASALDDPDSDNTIDLFYMMMGLGFDGIYKNDRDFIEKRMRVCMTRMRGTDITTEPLTPLTDTPDRCAPQKSKSFFFNLRFAAVVAGILLVIAMAANITAFVQATANYRAALSEATDASIPVSSEVRGLYTEKEIK